MGQTNVTVGVALYPNTKPAAQMKCTVCQHVYDAAKDGGGKKFEDLPDTWKCPVCGAPKSAYVKIDGQWVHDHADDDAKSFASCTYVNPFANAKTCFEMRGDTWTDASAAARCKAAMANVEGTLVKGGKCSASNMVG